MCTHRTAKELTLAYCVANILELIPNFSWNVGKKIETSRCQLLPWPQRSLQPHEELYLLVFPKHRVFKQPNRGLQSSRLQNRTLQGKRKWEGVWGGGQPHTAKDLKAKQTIWTEEITVFCTLPFLTPRWCALTLHKRPHMQCPGGITEIMLKMLRDKSLTQRTQSSPVS